MSVTTDNVPFVVFSTGRHPLEPMSPDASFSCIVIVTVLTPSATTDGADDVINVLELVATAYFTDALGKFVHGPLLTRRRKKVVALITGGS